MVKHESNLRLIRFSDLVRLGIVRNRMTLYRWIERGHFPAPIKIGPSSVAWRESEIEAWLERQPRDHRA